MHVEARHGLDELRQLGRSQRDARMRVRVQAIVLARQGRTAVEIGRTLDVGRRSVQEWVRRYNHSGMDGLGHRPGQGRPWRLTKEERNRLCHRIESGPGPADPVCTLRGKDVQRILQDEFGILYRLSGVYGLLHRLGYSCLMPRSQHPQSDPQAQEAFKKTSSNRFKPSARRIRRSESRSGLKMRPASGSKAR